MDTQSDGCFLDSKNRRGKKPESPIRGEKSACEELVKMANLQGTRFLALSSHRGWDVAVMTGQEARKWRTGDRQKAAGQVRARQDKAGEVTTSKQTAFHPHYQRPSSCRCSPAAWHRGQRLLPPLGPPPTRTSVRLQPIFSPPHRADGRTEEADNEWSGNLDWRKKPYVRPNVVGLAPRQDSQPLESRGQRL